MSLDQILREVANDQQREAIRSAYAHLDRLRDEEAKLDQLPAWDRRRGPRAGQLVALARDARERLAELEAIRDVEAAFHLEPTLDPEPDRTWRPGLPKPWRLEASRRPAPGWKL